MDAVLHRTASSVTTHCMCSSCLSSKGWALAWHTCEEACCKAPVSVTVGMLLPSRSVCRRGSQTWDSVSQWILGRMTVSPSVRCFTVVVSWQLDLMILEVFLNLHDSMIRLGWQSNWDGISGLSSLRWVSPSFVCKSCHIPSSGLWLPSTAASAASTAFLQQRF